VENKPQAHSRNLLDARLLYKNFFIALHHRVPNWSACHPPLFIDNPLLLAAS
jgi:hypothetical protein